MVATFSNSALLACLSLVSAFSVASKPLAKSLSKTDSQTIALGAAAQLQILQRHDPNLKEETGKNTDKVRHDPNFKEETGKNTDEVKLKTTESSGNKAFTDATLLLKKPIGDHRTYQHTTLANGMEVINVLDDSTKSSAFAVAVTAGLYYDPPEHLGLAHLTEHSLFLGTEKYPDRTGFDEYLAMSGGASNAYTSEEVTVYYGNLDNEAFNKGLDRFADMFRAPLLNASSVYQEVSAVVSEHSKNVQNPTWYCERVMLSTASNSSPLQHFHTGDASTLQNLGKDSVTNDIKSYFKNNYCPPRMKLVTFGAESVDDQLAMANATFGNIPKAGTQGACNAMKQTFQEPEAFASDRLQKSLLVAGTSGSASLWMLFPLKDLSPMKKSHPMNYAEYMLGYGGKNSLQLVLRDQLGLADGVSLSADDSSAGTMVWITASLTAEGVQKPGAVMDVIFTFLAHAKKGCTDKGMDTIQSLAKSAKLNWDWTSPMEADTAASTIAESMTRLQKEDILSADDLMEEPSTTLALEVMSKLHPGGMNIGLVIPDADQIWKANPNDFTVHTLPHYGVKYSVSKFDDYWGDTWKGWGGDDTEHASDDEHMTNAYTKLAARLRAQNVSFDGEITMALPGEIDGIPENMQLTHATADKGEDLISQLWGRKAHQLHDDGNDKAELWYRKGWMLPQPWVEASVTLRGPKVDVSDLIPAHDIVTLQVGMHLLADELNERLADTGYKGFYFSVSETHHGVYVWLGGFTPNLLSLTDRLLAEVNKALDKENNAALTRVTDGLRSTFTDYSEEAIKSGFADVKVLLTPHMHSKKELADAFTHGPKITYASAKQMVETARHGPFYSSSLVMGNYAEEDAKALHERILTGLGATEGVSESQVEKVSPVVMPKGPVEVRKANPREGDENHVTIVTILVGPATVQNRVLLGLVGSMYSQLVFAELRTKDELGYVVSGGVSEQSTILTINCYVQGSKKLPDEVEAKCENVWANTVPHQVSILDNESFKSHKEAFKASLLEGPLSTNQELSHFEDPILLGGCAGLRKAMLNFLETVEKDDLLEAWKDATTPGNATHVMPRKKVVVKYWKGAMEIPDPMTYKQAKEVYQAANLSGTILTRMLLEFNSTQYLSEANSSIRDELVKEGGYFPTDLHCTYGAQNESDTVVADTDKPDTEEDMPVLLKMKHNAIEISANGVGVKAGIMRKEMDIMQSVLPHRGGDGGAEEAEARTVADHATHLASHRHRFVARRPHLQPRPASPAAFFGDFAGQPSRVRGNLPGLSGGRQGGRQRLPPWERGVLPRQFSEFESSPVPHRTRLSHSAKRRT